MPIDEQSIFWNWNSLDPKVHEILARCVQEGLNEIEIITKEAETILKDGTRDGRFAGTEDPSFDGYGGGPDRVRDQVQALFYHLQDLRPKVGKDLSYAYEPWDSTATCQRVRLIREVLHYGRGTCIDWVVLLASCLAHVKLNPLIIITEAPPPTEDMPPQRHAILGYWLKEQMLPEPVMLGQDFIRFLRNKEIWWWKRHLFGVVNATRIPPDENGQKKSFDGKGGAEGEAITHLPNSARPFVIGPMQQIAPAYSAPKILLVVDIRAAREAGIKPLLPLEPWSDNHPLPRAEHFQERLELEDVRKWWRNENSYSVLALVGIGGAGKTAVVQRFLAQLPGSHVQEELEVEKDRTLPIPDALFVWSFYQHPDVDRCATALYNYLTDQQVNKATFEQVQEVLSQNWRGCRVLLIFDGVEKLQIAPGIEPEEGGTFGQFLPEGAPLARFLRWCCDGPRPAHVLITSRFSLTDLRRYESAGSYCVVDAGDLPLESARALLRAHGVKGLDWQLDELIREFGNHAQTLDLLGNALRIWCDGDPSQISKLPSLEDVKRLPGIRDKVWGRVRVLRFYEEILPHEELAVLQLLCAFEVMPVDAGTLTGVACLVAKSAPDTFGMLTGFSSLDVKGHLISLEYEYHLAHSTIGKGGSRTYFVHRAIQDYFWDRLPWNAKNTVHKEIAYFLASLSPLASLIERIKGIKGTPVYFEPIEEAHLDELEELIRHLVKVAEVLPAWNLYFFGMGAFARLGAELGLYSRGERLARLFAELQFESLNLPICSDPIRGLEATIRALHAFHKLKSEFLNERGIYAFSLGELGTAVTSYREAVELHVEFRDLKNACISCANLCEGSFLQGRLSKAVSAGVYGLETAGFGFRERTLASYEGDASVFVSEQNVFFNRPEINEQLAWLSAYVAYALILRGQTVAATSRLKEATLYFSLATKRPETVIPHALLRGLAEKLGLAASTPTPWELAQRGILFSISGVYQAAFWLRLGHLETAYDMLISNRSICEQSGLKRDVSRCDLLLAEIYRMQQRVDQARESLAQALDWGKRTGDQEVIVWGNLISARLALDAGGLDEAEQAIREGLRIAEYCGYGLYWIDLQVAKGQWELACGRQSQAGKGLPPELENWTPQQWFERAEASALRALNGQLKESDDPAPRPDLPEDQLAMLGARHPECGYAWGEGDALHLLGEALLALAQYVGPGGHDSKGRSYAELLKEAHQAAEEALTLRQRIQDPKAKETQELLQKIQEMQDGTL